MYYKSNFHLFNDLYCDDLIIKLSKDKQCITSAKNEVEKQKALAEEDRSRLHRDKLKMSKELSQVRDERIVLQNEIKEEHRNYNRLAVELMQARETYADKVNSLKAEVQQLESDRKELLLRYYKQHIGFNDERMCFFAKK